MDDCLLFEDCSYLAQWPGVPVHDSEGQIITAALGKSSSVVLAGHGYVATGESVEIATYRAVAIEQCAQRALLALAVGNQQNLDPAAARQAREFLHQPEIVSLTFSYWARRSGVANWTTQGAQQ
jgi:L-fuculose-phosphate aldolase